MNEQRITFRAVLLGTLASALFAWYTVVTENLSANQRILTATQIPVLPYLFVILLVLAVNPLLRRIRLIRSLSPAEVMMIFVMTMVSAGVSTFGLASPLVPVVAGLFNRDWNNAQARWDRYIQPFVNEAYFIAEPGMQARSLETLEAETAWRESDALLRTARLVEAAETAVLRTRDRLDAMPDVGAARRRLERNLALEQDRLNQALALWAPYAGQDRGQVLASVPEQATALEAVYRERRERLRELEQKAFERVAVFRTGLPAPLRAIPGILPSGREGIGVYLARLRRLAAGLSVRHDLDTAARELPSEGRMPEGVAMALQENLNAAAERLAEVSETEHLEERRREMQQRREERDAEAARRRSEMESLRVRRRMADADEVSALDRTIGAMQSDLDAVLRDLERIRIEMADVVDVRFQLAAEMAAVRDALRQLEQRLADGFRDAAATGAALQAALSSIDDLQISWRTLFAGDVPWGLWIGPMSRWLLLILCTYVMLMTFNMLIYRQWAHHEKLVYPLAELPMRLGGADEPIANRIPSLYRSGLFWAGAALSTFVLGWNIMAARQVIPGIFPIRLHFDWTPYIAGSMFEGLLPNAHHQIFFTLIGISFLVPARISKSLWGFHLLYMALLLVMVWAGYGVNESSFPVNLTMVMNFRTAIGGGALIAFSAMTLWKCRRYLFCGAWPQVLAGLEPAERRELRIASVIFILCSVLLVALLTLGMGANVFFAVFCYLVIVVVTIGMVRVVAEGGLLVFQCWFNPFHMIRSTIGMHRAWSASSMLAPLVFFYYVLFFDLKTFIAPGMANALKIRDSVSMRRLQFHAALWIGLLVALLTALATHIVLAYHHGANAMHDWFYIFGPRGHLFGWIKEMAIANPVDEAGGGYWMLAGMIAMTALLLMRRKHYRLPHPIGLVMWVNPVMWSFWFSIFLGWMFKILVSRYGDRGTYQKFRDFFIGLIVGELVMCLFGVDLNRN